MHPFLMARTLEYTIILALFFSSEGLAATQLEITNTQHQEVILWKARYSKCYTYNRRIPHRLSQSSFHRHEFPQAANRWRCEHNPHDLSRSFASLVVHDVGDEYYADDAHVFPPSSDRLWFFPL